MSASDERPRMAGPEMSDIDQQPPPGVPSGDGGGREGRAMEGPERANQYFIETLGCPKNQVDSDKLAGTFAAAGLEPAQDAESADVIVVNTCAFIEAAREESIEVMLAAAAGRKDGAR